MRTAEEMDLKSQSDRHEAHVKECNPLTVTDAENIEKFRSVLDEYRGGPKVWLLTDFALQIFATFTSLYNAVHGAPLSRLREICDAEREQRCVVLPCKEFFSKAGDYLYLIDGGDIIEVMHCGCQISPDGELYAIVAADDKIFPYREPIAEYDMDPSDWCTNAKEIEPRDFGKTVFLTRAEADAAKGDKQ